MKLLLVVVALVLAATTTTTSVLAALPIQLWSRTLPASTNLPIQISIWNDPQAAFFTANSTISYYGVTAANGGFFLFDADLGEMLWERSAASFPAGAGGGSVSGCVKRNSAGNEHGLFLFQNGAVLSLDVRTGMTKWSAKLPAPLNPSQTIMKLYGDQILLNDDTSFYSLSTATGVTRWYRNDFAKGVVNAYRVDISTNSGRVAFLTVRGGRSTVLVVDRTGAPVLKWAVPRAPFLASVDDKTVTGIFLDDTAPHFCRYPTYCKPVAAADPSERVTGYSLSNFFGGAATGGAGGFQILFINTNVRTHSYHYATGEQMQNGESAPHAKGHLVAMSNRATVTSSLSSGGIKIVLFNASDMTLPIPPVEISEQSAEPYNIRENWYHSIVAPLKRSGFVYVDSATATATPFTAATEAPIVVHNLVVREKSFFFTAGNVVYGYKI